MSVNPKSYNKILSDMIQDAVSTHSIEDLASGSATKALIDALEAGMYWGCPKHEVGVRRVLGRLGIKSAEVNDGLIGGKALKMESLEATLKNVTFDDASLKLWKKP